MDSLKRIGRSSRTSDFSVRTLKHLTLHQDLHHFEHYLWKVMKSYGKARFRKELKRKALTAYDMSCNTPKCDPDHEVH